MNIERSKQNTKIEQPSAENNNINVEKQHNLIEAKKYLEPLDNHIRFGAVANGLRRAGLIEASDKIMALISDKQLISQ